MRDLVAVAMFALFTTAGCGGPELPLGWSDAREVELDQATCDSSDPAAELDHAVHVYLRASRLHVEATVSARCSQELCAYRQRVVGTEQFLVQPCDLHPGTVAKCSCRYGLRLSSKNERAEQRVELYQRGDYWGGDPGPPVMFYSGTALSE